MTTASEQTVDQLLATRRSPYSFDPERPVASADLRAVFEAARWTMSSYNEQPWRYIVANRASDEALWARLLGVLVEGNQAWARYAPVLALGLYVPTFSRNDKPNRAAEHDLGAASALLTVAAAARGLSVHQMIGIEPDKAVAEFGLEGKATPLTALAIGYAGTNPQLPDGFREREAAPRSRRTVEELLLDGGFGD
ncbi:MAG: nitroreductase family protein [Pseudomonadota bacterium]